MTAIVDARSIGVTVDGVEVYRGSLFGARVEMARRKKAGQSPVYIDASGQPLTPLAMRKSQMSKMMRLAQAQRQLPESYAYSKKVQFS